MSLKSAIRKAVQQGMGAVADLNQSIVYHSTGTISTNNPARRPVETGAVDTTTTDITMVGYDSNDVDGSHILATDQKGLWSQLACPITPAEIDYLTDEAGDRWNVKSISQDPAGAVWILQLRKV